MLTPPTDSLYKFLAVFGLVLVVTAFLIDSQARRSYNSAFASSLAEIAKAGDEELAQARRQLELVNQLKNYDSKTDDGARQQQKILDQLASPELHKSHAEFEHSESYIKAQKMYDFETAEYLRAAQRFGVLLIAGILVAATGFYLWYVKIQRFLDKQLATDNRKPTVDSDNPA